MIELTISKFCLVHALTVFTRITHIHPKKMPRKRHKHESHATVPWHQRQRGKWSVLFRVAVLSFNMRCTKMNYNRRGRCKQFFLFFFVFLFLFFFYLGFTALSRIFHLYRAGRSSKVGENRRTRRKTTWPSVSRTWLSHMWPERGSNHSGEKPNGLRVNSLIH